MTAGGGLDLYIQKLDSAGNFIWAKQIGGTTTADTVMSTGKEGAILHNNQLLISGHFINIVDFDPGLGATSRTAFIRNLFLLKLDTAGNLVWVQSEMGGVNHYIEVVEQDPLGNIYLAGNYADTIDLNISFTTGFDTKFSQGGYDCFVVQVDSSGNYITGESYGGTGNDYLTDLTRDDIQGFMIASGSFENTIDFGSGGIHNLTSNGMSDAFVAYLTNVGLCFMSKQIGGTGNDEISVIEYGTNGAIYCAGSFQGTVDFNPNAARDLFTASNSEDNFVVKLDTAGTYFYGKMIEGVGQIEFKELTTDNNNSLLFYGTINGTVDIDPSTTVNPITTTGLVLMLCIIQALIRAQVNLALVRIPLFSMLPLLCNQLLLVSYKKWRSVALL